MGTNLGENIRKARKALKLSQDALGELIGANRVTISKYENNEYNPSLPALKRLAEALHTTQAKLTGDEPDTKKEPTASDGQTSPVDGNLAAMYAKFSLLSPSDQQRVLDFAEGILSAREQ